MAWRVQGDVSTDLRPSRRLHSGANGTVSAVPLGVALVVATLASCQPSGPQLPPSASPSLCPPTAVPPRASAVPTEIVTTRVGSSPEASVSSVAVDASQGRVYAVELAPGFLSILDGETMRRVGGLPGLSAAEQVAVDPVRETVFVAAAGGKIWAIDARTPRVLLTARLGPPVVEDVYDLEVDPRAERIYVLTSEGGLWVLDEGTLERLARVSARGSALALDQTRSRLYVSNRHRVLVVDTSTTQVVDTFPVGGSAAAVDPVTNTLYLVRPGHDVGVLEVVDATTGDVVTSIKSGVWPTDVEVDPKRDRAYVIDQGALNIEAVDPDAGLVWVVNTRSNRLVRTLSIGISPSQAAFDCGMGALYILDPNAATLSRVVPV
jgi:hypothetical protein